MFTGIFFGPVALLYYCCFLLLGGLTLVIAWRGRRRPTRRSRLRRLFCQLALSLLVWQGTLFLEVRLPYPAWQLWLGRANFAAVAVAAYLALRFVQAVPENAARSRPSSRWLPAATGLLATLTLFTPLVAAAERVEAGHAVTTFGLFFPWYLFHVHGCLAAALIQTFQGQRHARNSLLRGQFALIGTGMLATGGVATVTNALLPYAFDDFRFCDVGTLSTLLFVLAVAHATFLYRLFDLRLLIRKTLVYGLLLTFVLGSYSSALFLVTQFLTTGAERWTQFAVLLIAFSVDPLRRFLERKTDQWLFEEGADKNPGPTGRGRPSARLRSPLSLALLFPWRRE